VSIARTDKALTEYLTMAEGDRFEVLEIYRKGI